MRLRTRLAVLVAGVALVVSACGGVGPGTTDGTTKRVKIVSSLPLQGASRTQTVTIVNAITMAIEEVNNKVGNFTIVYESMDDATAARQSWDGPTEAENARKAVADPEVVAYIATFNSGAAKISIPITCQANLAMISPANTYPGLSKSGVPGIEPNEPGVYYPNCKRNYSRVVPADDLQGAVGARWAKELGFTKVYILDDRELYGKGLADVFEAEARKIGLTVVAHEGAPKADNFRTLANKVTQSGADLVYYSGITDNNPGFLLRDLKQANPNIKFMSVDGVAESVFLSQAAASAEGAYITFGGFPPSEYTGKAKTWLDAYTGKYNSRPEVYAVYGYEAAKVVLAALAKAGDKADDRATVRDAIMGTRDFDGVLGKWSFTESGDTTLTVMAGMIVKSGDFAFQKELK